MTELSRIIADEIRRNGPISMARFMELALYCPVYGYYERQADSVGRAGDFQTSVSVGPMFGELLAARFAVWLDELSQRGGKRFHLVEAGAHDGQLAADILGWISRSRPDLASRLDYHLLEPSTARQERQAARLNDYSHQLTWSSDFDQLLETTGGVRGVIFSNELLDALPVDRFAWDRGRQGWFTWRVAEGAGRFVWSRGGAPDARAGRALDHLVPPEVREVLTDGYVIDYCPEAASWWRHAAASLKQGWLATIDYGFPAGSAVLPERIGGTLRGYRQHQVTENVLSDPGQQDLTAHVHFDELRLIGEGCGMKTEFLGSQERFLVRTLEESHRSIQDALVRNAGRLRQFKTLIHPDHFGHSFQALVQSRL